MFNIEITPLVKTEIRPVPEAQLLDQLYRIFLDKGVHFRVEQVNDESIVFYWTDSSEYVSDTIAVEIGELLNPVAANAKAKAAETEQPKVKEQQKDEPHVLWYEGENIEQIKKVLETFYSGDLGIYWDNSKLVVRLKKDDRNFMEEVRSIAELIDNGAVLLISFQGIGKSEADEFMRGAVHEHKEKIHQSNYVRDTLTVLVDKDPVVINQLRTRMDELIKKNSRKCAERQDAINYTGPEAKDINDTLAAFYSSRVETKLEGEQLTIKLPLDDLSLGDEIRGLIDDIVNKRLRVLSIIAIGKEDADTFMRDITRWFPEKVRQWTYTDNTLTILLNYEPGIIGKLKTHLSDLRSVRFLKDNEHTIDALFREISSGVVCDCPACQKHR
ncbi:hypothetical protein DQB62_04025 [Shigella flexneri]|nr:hypothetical protein [Shigella flexneri]